MHLVGFTTDIERYLSDPHRHTDTHTHTQRLCSRASPISNPGVVTVRWILDECSVEHSTTLVAYIRLRGVSEVELQIASERFATKCQVTVELKSVGKRQCRNRTTTLRSSTLFPSHCTDCAILDFYSKTVSSPEFVQVNPRTNSMSLSNTISARHPRYFTAVLAT